MAPRSPKTRILRATRARAVQYYGEASPQAIAAKQALTEQVTRDFIERVLAEAPPLTTEQRVRLAELLAPARESAAKAGK